jgi:7,8-dihydropterin-6-yl-methyl-4-(beta-D-ribofuranosyl)aminobenzene 5'-phosphate synthase
MLHKRIRIPLLIAAMMVWSMSWGRGQDVSLKGRTGITNPIRISVIVDNYAASADTKTNWGFSCLIEGAEKTILFDAGADPDIFMHNVAQMKIDLSRVQQVVISHDHGDHTGGLLPALARSRNASVYLLSAFSPELQKNIKGAGAGVLFADQSRELCPSVFVSGSLGTQIKEQALIVNTGKGLVVITGCAHPGIVSMLKKIKEEFARDIYLVLGGFHLLELQDTQVKDIIGQFRTLGVTQCGATHCTGDKAIALFKEAYGADYVSLGAGRVFQVTDAGVK